MESVSQIERAGARSKAQWGRNQVMGETAGNWNDWAHRPDSANANPSHTKLKTHSVCVRGSREGRMKRLPRHRWQVGPSPHPRKKVPRVKLEALFLSAAAAATRRFEPRVLTRGRVRACLRHFGGGVFALSTLLVSPSSTSAFHAVKMSKWPSLFPARASARKEGKRRSRWRQPAD